MTPKPETRTPILASRNVVRLSTDEKSANEVHEASKVLLFINGTPPKNFPDLENYALIACTDGAFRYLKSQKFPMKKLDFVSGDFDSQSEKLLLKAKQNADFEIIQTPNQDKTDFEKSLEIILNKGFREVDVFGGSGKEMDHFLGNISAAFKFKNDLNIKFYDDFSEYFFIPKHFKTQNAKGKTISLYPFPDAKNITTKGLKWALNKENLSLASRIGTRNIAVENEISIQYETGDLLIFIGSIQQLKN
ncbi:MAG: thiamine diphosphokinase [Flavobacteriaceae bacterium]|jgi:thiamine pyrophosphokinase|nr:thiamine diphosphokinase [Flavobacteriaceae bacterium]